MRRVPALLDVSLLTAPFGSSDPFAFYRALDVARDATVDEINEEYKNWRYITIPTSTLLLNATFGPLNFRF